MLTFKHYNLSDDNFKDFTFPSIVVVSKGYLLCDISDTFFYNYPPSSVSNLFQMG